MDAEIRPEPTPEERAAILAALVASLGPEPDPRGAWWHAGVAENTSGREATPDGLGSL